METQADAGYKRGEGTICGKCCNYIHGGPHEPAATCAMVQGTIAPYGTCRFWRRMPNPFGALKGEEIINVHKRIIQRVRKTMR